jgi:predicted ATPase
MVSRYRDKRAAPGIGRRLRCRYRRTTPQTEASPVPQEITRIRAQRFRSLADVDVRLGRLNVLIGPNGSGKTNLLKVLQFLATMARYDLSFAVRDWNGFDHIQRQAGKPLPVRLTIEGRITEHSSGNALDEYMLRLSQTASGISRTEEFTFKRSSGRGRRYKASGKEIEISDLDSDAPRQVQRVADAQTTGLATLPKLADEQGGLGIRTFANFLSSIRVLEPDVVAARQPSRPYNANLADDASNLADALAQLKVSDPDAWPLLVADVRSCLPGLDEIQIVPVGGPGRAVSVQLVEQGVTKPIELADASFGTVRVLALLTALHEPDPPPFTAIEEIDHGLHPYALDILVDRMRAASSRTQILAATHSPTLVNRLTADEIIVCDRDPDTGASLIPATSSKQIRAQLAATDWQAGELWFSGALRGVPA